MLTDSQKKIIDLSKKIEGMKNEMKNLNTEIERLLSEVGVGRSFQDPEDGVVFEIVSPKGTFVNFKTIDYERTKRAGETRGSLSVARAKELGFTV